MIQYMYVWHKVIFRLQLHRAEAVANVDWSGRDFDFTNKIERSILAWQPRRTTLTKTKGLVVFLETKNTIMIDCRTKGQTSSLFAASVQKC